MKRLIPILLLLATAPGLAEMQIFKCVEEGVTVFSDTPCAEGVEAFMPVQRLSIVEADPNMLDWLAEQNRDFIQQRLDRLAARRQAAIEAERHAAHVPLAPAYPQPVFTGFALIDQRGRRAHGKPRAPVTGRQAPQQDERFSALSGRFPGTRRR